MVTTYLLGAPQKEATSDTENTDHKHVLITQGHKMQGDTRGLEQAGVSEIRSSVTPCSLTADGTGPRCRRPQGGTLGSRQLCPPSARLQQEGGREGETPLLKQSPQSSLGALFHMGHAVTKHKSPSVVSQGLFSCLYSPQ